MDVLNVDMTGSDEENEDGIQRLVEGLNLNDLSTSGTEFSVQVSEDAALEEQSCYGDKEAFPHLNLSCLGPEEGEEEPTSHDATTPFAHLALKMSNLTEDGKVKKRIMTEGYGEVVPQEALVWFHYNSYREFQDIPFDSSYLRGQMTMIRLNSGKCILGLDIGLSTMKLGEKSQFLIHYDYAYGKLGVFPRIPAEAEILMEVEMKKFVDNALALKMGELNDEELKTMPFEVIYKGARSLLLEGNSAFSQKKFPLAVKWYRNALRSLENCDMNTDEDEFKNEALRLKLYTNLGVCHNKMNNSKQAIVMCRNALQIEPNGAKILYQLGLAHLNLSSFDEAKKFAYKARRISPRNPDINMLLQKIDGKMERYNASEISFAKNAFKFVENNSKIVDKSNGNQNEVVNGESSCAKQNECIEGTKITEITEDLNRSPKEATTKQVSNKENLLDACPDAEYDANFELETISYIEQFVDDPTERQLALPFGLTYEEEMFFKKQARLYNLRWEERQEEAKVVVYLLK